MFKSQATMSRAKAARELEREILMTMEVVTGEEALQINLHDFDDAEAAQEQSLNFGPHSVSPLRGLPFDPSNNDTAA